ncbi:MAG: hypothetical protein IKZ28_00310 [Clostridia bacterium]|nr:hypothetical protein [Clostridia bacterium]
MKKSAAFISLALAAMVGVATLTGCAWFKKKGNEETKTVMNLSLNPEVEFVLDANHKVLTVNALNEEGNLIISAEAFEDVIGEEAEDAAELFVEVAKETGYLVEGSANIGENEIKISFSGDTEKAESLYNEVKTELTEYLSEENIKATVSQAAAITEAQMKVLVAECAPYVDTAKMKYTELMDVLVESRKETAEFYSQELKNAYYETKAFVLKQAELEVLREQLNVVEQAIFDGINKIYTETIESIENTRMVTLVSEDSLYQKALKAFRETKIEYLNYRKEVSVGDTQISVEINSNLENLKKLVEKSEEALLKVGEDANAALDKMKSSIMENHEKMMALFEKNSVKANKYLEAISQKQQEAKATFFTNFEKDYASAISAAETNWANMQAALQGESTMEDGSKA